MSAIRLYRNKCDEWVFDHQGSEHVAQLTSVDEAATLRMLGLHPEGVVLIHVNFGGSIESVKLLDDTPLAELMVPKGHSLHRDLTPV